VSNNRFTFDGTKGEKPEPAKNNGKGRKLLLAKAIPEAVLF